HARWPWSAARWQWVAARMAAMTSLRWLATGAELRLVLAAAGSVRGWANPHLGPALSALDLAQPPLAFDEPAARCRSFSAFWSRVQARQPHSHPRSTQGDLFHV
ncbi:MAG: deoxyribodipyrimidine photolyase, partial [Burkholderiales bacterium]|nr:deoxyribodipyrimidine photolyase [Burkholderiales bacterium]